MKDCPKCYRVYADDSLRFCLDDGATLRSAASGQPTIRARPAGITVAKTEPLPRAEDRTPARTSALPWVVAIVAVVLAGVVIVTSSIVLIVNRRSVTAAASPTPQRQTSATPTPESGIVNLAGTHWHDTTSVNVSTKSYYFNPNGTINDNTSDTWRQDGRTVVLEFTNGYAHYDGTINGDQIDYKAHNKVNFEWSATLVRDK